MSTLKTHDLINGLFLIDLKSKLNLDPNFSKAELKARVWDNSVELFLSEDDKIIFGSNIDIHTRRDWETKEREFKFNTGSMGSFDLSCTASCGRHLLMAELIKNFDAVKEVCFAWCDAVEQTEKTQS